MKIEFDFLPPSVNTAFYTDFRTRTRHKTKPYREFIRNLEGYVPQCNPTLLDGELEVEINCYFPDKRKRDIANYEKCLIDTIVHYGLITDDSQIQRLVLEKYYDKGKPFTIIEIKSKIDTVDSP